VAEGQLTTLTSADIRRFERDGYVVARQAFSPADGLAMEPSCSTASRREQRDRQQRLPS